MHRLSVFGVFFIALHLVALVRVLMLKGTGIALGTSVSVTLAALILGEAVLIADLLPFINRCPDKPLVYNVAWKTTIYALIAMLVHYLERLDHATVARGRVNSTPPIYYCGSQGHAIFIKLLS